MADELAIMVIAGIANERSPFPQLGKTSTGLPAGRPDIIHILCEVQLHMAVGLTVGRLSPDRIIEK